MQKVISDVTCDITTYSESLAHSLINYADEHPTFASYLHTLVSSLHLKFSDTLTHTPKNVVPLALKNEDQAKRRALWLADISSHKQQGARDLGLQTLAAWSHTRSEDEPRSVVLGLKYGVINFGIIGHPGSRHEPMNIIARNDAVKEKSAIDLAKTCTTLTHRIVEQGLVAAHGNTKKLEPELSDWMFGEKNIVLHTGSVSTLGALQKEIKSFHAPYVILKDEKGPSFIAITPTVYINNLAAYSSLRTLKS